MRVDPGGAVGEVFGGFAGARTGDRGTGDGDVDRNEPGGSAVNGTGGGDDCDAQPCGGRWVIGGCRYSYIKCGRDNHDNGDGAGSCAVEGGMKRGRKSKAKKLKAPK